ncbi:PTS sugar transporter subunit IIA [Zophobihabitans entericus]|uniref:PTS EIIA type-4 domain-containing protein n=1 Tax=Zophobihabitans entericus TaxID=1635327 RepID=A0A6G9IC90_9GAMM|nr:hypothetical protein [Zophobihabitans entericus]QIQ21324.1 hypothetical protein IPMB12_06260 [Zophobihabitans entericus]
MQIIVTSHGDLCEGILSSYEMVAGKSHHITPVKLTDKGISDYTQRLTEQLDQIILHEPVLILCDLEGGTPYNESYKYLLQHPDKVRVICGLNLPMLIEAGLAVSDISDQDELVELTLNAAMQSIKSIDAEQPEDELDF